MIDRFVMGEMEGQELQDFRNKLASDANLQARVNEARLLITGIRESALGPKLNSFHAELPKQIQRSAPARSLGRLAAAASVVVILSLAAVWFFTRPSANAQLYTSYFQPDPGLLTAMGSSDNYEFDRGMVDYKSGKYSEAIKVWQGIKGNDSDTLSYFIASAFLASGKNDSSFASFQKISSSSAFVSEAHWYKGLILVKSNNADGAINELQQSARKEKNELIEKIRKQ